MKNLYLKYQKKKKLSKLNSMKTKDPIFKNRNKFEHTLKKKNVYIK